MHKSRTLIILDWDDTLFPTSWIIKTGINLNNPLTLNKYIILFTKLDIILHNLLKNLLKCGKVVIVTNAMVKWVTLSSKALPNTRKLIKKNILVISARDEYQRKYPNNMDVWKKLLFEDVVNTYFKKNGVENIISIGDAEYEFNALIDLYNAQKDKRILKAVRFMRYPSYDSLIDQLEVLINSIKKICYSQGHLDLKFENI